MRAEKNGFVLIIEGTWCEISNRYGVASRYISRNAGT